jgi:hypothetical protein
MSVSFIIFSSAFISSNHLLLLNLGMPYFMLMLKSAWICAFQQWNLTTKIMQLVYSTVMKSSSWKRIKMSSICKTNELRGLVKYSYLLFFFFSLRTQIYALGLVHRAPWYIIYTLSFPNSFNLCWWHCRFVESLDLVWKCNNSLFYCSFCLCPCWVIMIWRCRRNTII